MRSEHIENVYYTLTGVLNDECCVPGVENLFAEGGECEHAYSRMLEAYARLRDRLGVAEEDADVEVMINSFLKMECMVAVKMFEYGMKFAEHN